MHFINHLILSLLLLYPFQSNYVQQEKSHSKVLINSIGMKFTLIPSGSFIMGGTQLNEQPPHLVEITNEFYMGTFEVTQKEFEIVIGRKPKKYLGSNYPVGATWNEANEFCNRLSELTGDNYRLPTEAEWEYAARGGLDQKTFVWGNDPIPMIGNVKFTNVPDESAHNEFPDLDYIVDYDDSFSGLAPVGSFAPNGFGLYDMCGNAWERCSDWYDENYYVVSPKNNPIGPDTGEKKVLRGGGYYFSPISKLRVAYRCGSPLDRGGSNDGFRVVLEIK